MATDLIIGIGAEYTGAPAFAKANKSITGLEKGINKLAKQFTGLFAAQKLLAFGKESIIAFKDDALAARTLTQTLDNLGLAFEDTRVKTMIANLESTYKVLDDKLRPAFQSLLQVTHSVSISQKMLETALNTSAATGTDLETVTQDLAQAYVGNLRGLRKYNLGLTQAELATKSYSEIQELMNSKFRDQAMIKAADPLNALSVAANNAKETIGKGLVDALAQLVSGSDDINKLTEAMDKWANRASKTLNFMGTLASVAAENFAQSPGGKAIIWLMNRGEINISPNQMQKGQYARGGGKALDLLAAKRAQEDKDAIKRQKELTLLTQKQAIAAAAAAKAKKEAAILEKAQQLFNIDLIQNVAALQGKITADEKLRLETQQAILTGNAESAGQLAMKLLEAQKNAMLLRQTDPFLGWTDSAAAALAAIQKMIDALKLLGIEQSKTYMPSIGISSGTYYKSSQGVSSLTPAIGTSYEYFAGLSGGKYGSTPTYTPQIVDVNVSVVNGSIVADAQNSAMSGNSYSYSRLDPLRFG